jgi:hypothetical protein
MLSVTSIFSIAWEVGPHSVSKTGKVPRHSPPPPGTDSHNWHPKCLVLAMNLGPVPALTPYSNRLFCISFNLPITAHLQFSAMTPLDDAVFVSRTIKLITCAATPSQLLMMYNNHHT